MLWKFYNTIDPYDDNLHLDFKFKAQKQLRDAYPFSCNIREDYVTNFIFELVLHCQIEEIHRHVVDSVHNFNRVARSSYFLEFKDLQGEVHPIVDILHRCARSLQQLEYSASQDPVAETAGYVKSKVKIKDFSFIPKNIAEVLSVKGHVKTLVSRVNVNRDLVKLLRDLEHKRTVELGD